MNGLLGIALDIRYKKVCWLFCFFPQTFQSALKKNLPALEIV